MASFLTGFQLPFQRRLTKMYTDTKSSYDFLKEPIQVNEDSELSSLHRKLRIQKDRLVSWGLEWSDPSQSPDIDESLSKAGLGDVVGSVMSTIKDILAEAEPLWNSSKRNLESKGQGSDMAGDAKTTLISWDRSRFEDLMRDLTSSIDTLYDLSRTRQSARSLSGPKKVFPSVASHVKAGRNAQRREFESTRRKTPQQIDPACLIFPNRIQDVESLHLSSGSQQYEGVETREIAYMNRQSAAASPWKTDKSLLLAPMLVEYSAYDPIYANTGIPPPMDRFEKFFAGLQGSQEAFDKLEFGVLNLVGYFEDILNARFGLVYELPARFSPLPSQEFLGHAVPHVTILSDLLSKPDCEPCLEVRFRLAYNIAISIADIQSKNIIHGSIGAKNIGFLKDTSGETDGDDPLKGINPRQPLLLSFDLFSDVTSRTSSDIHILVRQDLYRSRSHPFQSYSNANPTDESRSLDISSLGLLLLEIGLWKPLTSIKPLPSGNDATPLPLRKSLAAACGSTYLRAVEACWKSIAEESANHIDTDMVLDALFEEITTYLEKCCAIDDDIGPENLTNIEPVTSLPRSRDATQHQHSMTALYNRINARAPENKKTPPQIRAAAPGDNEIDESRRSNTQIAELGNNEISVNPLASSPHRLTESKPRLRMFPAVNIEQDHLNYWQCVLMPEINYVLRGFYRKYPESVEISLESIGETIDKTKPTILVVCTSVSKVRAILRKGFVYDKATYSLIVCRGKIFRSRKNPVRSMASRDEMPKAQNIEYQERPTNGASIGAFVEGQHLAPVSFGGLIKVDEKYYGMTVHHMLDDPTEQETPTAQTPARASAQSQHNVAEGDTFRAFELTTDSPEDGYAVSEYGSDACSETSSDGESLMDDDTTVSPFKEPGDIEGIYEGCGTGYAVTQPALDDVDEGFFPSDDDAMEDHLDTFRLGEIYASSGIRRKHQDGTAHEIDWALFEFSEDRIPPGNHIKGGEKHCRVLSRYPVEIAPWSRLHGLEVHCSGRSTGLQSGRILPGMTTVKFFGRQTPAQSYQVSGNLGIPGDSGAWIIDNVKGRVCGHVLGWSSRKQVAYICPMEILLSDISETLNARVTLPGSKSVSVTQPCANSSEATQVSSRTSDFEGRPRSYSASIKPLENVKRLVDAHYNLPEDELVTAMNSLHVGHELVSPN